MTNDVVLVEQVATADANTRRIANRKLANWLGDGNDAYAQLVAMPLIPPDSDCFVATYDVVTGKVSSYTYKKGGITGSTTGTVTILYDGLGRFSSAALT